MRWSTRCARTLGGRISFEVPNGGMAIWCRMEGKLDVDAWTSAAVLRACGSRPVACSRSTGRTRAFVRLGFAASREREIDAAVKKMAGVL
jgi:GntR family transcriptional regulator/MocR family aminotransferase